MHTSELFTCQDDMLQAATKESRLLQCWTQEALLRGLGQAIEALTRVAEENAQNQARLTAAIGRIATQQQADGGGVATGQTGQPASVSFDTGGKILKAPESFSPGTLEASGLTGRSPSRIFSLSWMRVI